MSHFIPVTVLTGAPSALIERLAVHAIEKRPQTTHAIVSSKPRRKRRQPPKPKGWISTKPRLARWGEGCGCCTVRADVASRTRRLLEEERAPELLLGLQLGEDLEPLLKTFTVADAEGRTLAAHAQVQRLVVVVSAAALHARRGVGELYGRIELAETVIVVRGEGEPEGRAEALIRVLNPGASLHSVTEAGLPALDLGEAEQPFDLWTARQRASQVVVLDADSQTGSGVERCVFRAFRPFHPQRLHDLLQSDWTGVARAHGPFWVASRPACAAMLQVNGDEKTTGLIGTWWASVPVEDRPKTRAFEQRSADWHPEFGDRVQELFIAGSTEGVGALKRRLEQALLGEEELSEGASFAHPFPWPQG